MGVIYTGDLKMPFIELLINNDMLGIVPDRIVRVLATVSMKNFHEYPFLSFGCKGHFSLFCVKIVIKIFRY